uniref:Metallo-beta-lactamase domain-containing protein n=1 Tax=Tetradesmus obliquus TaxID=3088 RepID=A0A383V4K8_TETOB|eukprot:jgi/Sobl393_1/7746/SZX59514.1
MATQVEHIKWVPGTTFIVDGFAFPSPRCTAYFLTHCHSDHTIGLRRDFASTIYCSPVSARLLAHDWGLRAPQVQVLQLGQPLLLQGVTVTAIDANHCPGAVMLLFEVPGAEGSVTRILHTGDCRWQDALRSGSCLARMRVDTLMLDTTYAHPKHTHPPQEEAIRMMVEVMRSELAEEPACLFVVGSYHIGKERAYLGAAQALGCKVYADAAKRRLLQLLDLPQEQLALLTDDPSAARLHVAHMAPPDPGRLAAAYVDKPGSPWQRVVAFRPTGWTFNKSGKLQVWREGAAAVVGVPYSEHSSWDELRQCVAALRPSKLIPTVNAGSKAKSAALVERFVDLMDLSSNRGRLDMFLVRRPAASSSQGAQLGQEQQQQAAHEQDQQHGLVLEACPVERQSSSVGGCEGACSCSPYSDTVFAQSGAQLQLQQTASGEQQADAASTPREMSLSVSTAFGDEGQKQQQPQQQQPQQQQQQDAAEQHIDLAGVDLAEQQRLLDEAQRLLRLKRSWAAARAAGRGKASAQPAKGAGRRRTFSKGS